jgi:hypothetical protein
MTVIASVAKQSSDFAFDFDFDFIYAGFSPAYPMKPKASSKKDFNFLKILKDFMDGFYYI